MKRYHTLLPTLAIVLGACGGEEASMDDMDMDMEAPAPAPAAAPAGGGSGLACYVAGGAPTTLAFNIGANPALLCYGAAAVAQLPNGEAWPLGDNEATTLHLSSRANVGGVALTPGSYSLYAIPGANGWQFFINSNWQRSGVPIDAGVRSTEVGNFTVAPQALPESVSQLRFEWEEAAGGDPGGDILLEWGGTLLRIPIEA